MNVALILAISITLMFIVDLIFNSMHEYNMYKYYENQELDDDEDTEDF